MGLISVPIHVVNLHTELVSGPVMIGIRPTLSVQGVSFILGNDLAGEQVMSEPCVSPKPQLNETSEDGDMQIPDIFPSCAVTMAMASKSKQFPPQSDCVPQSDDAAPNDPHLNLAETFISHDRTVSNAIPKTSNSDKSVDLVLTRDQLIKDQQADPELSVIAQRAFSER